MGQKGQWKVEEVHSKGLARNRKRPAQMLVVGQRTVC